MGISTTTVGIEVEIECETFRKIRPYSFFPFLKCLSFSLFRTTDLKGFFQDCKYFGPIRLGRPGD